QGLADEGELPSADEAGEVLVDGVARPYRSLAGTIPAWAEYQIINLFHSFAIEDDTAFPGTASFGDDYIAGGADNDMIFGQLGDDIIQGDGDIEGAVGVSDLNRITNGFTPLDLEPASINAGHRLQALDGTDFAFDGIADVDGGADTITLPTDGLSDGERFAYWNDGGGDDVGGLVSGGLYSIVVVDGDTIRLTAPVGAARILNGTFNLTPTLIDQPRNLLAITPSFEAASDGDDYIEGGGGGDVIFGNLGQDDIIGGSSSLFTLAEVTIDTVIDGDAATPTDEVQTITVEQSGATSFRLAFDGVLTAPIANDADAAVAEAALEGLATIGADNVSVIRADNVFTVTFQNALAAQNVSELRLVTQLRPDGADIIFGGAGTRIDHGHDVTDTADFLTDTVDFLDGNVDGGADTITIADHGFLGGETVIYGRAVNEVGGLADGETFVVDVVDPNTIQLLPDGLGAPIDLTAPVGGGTHTLTQPAVHARDADAIAGDNANIYPLVGVDSTPAPGFLTFDYDTDDAADQGYSAGLPIIPRAVELLDYTPGGPDFKPAEFLDPEAADIGGDDEVHGESGDDFIYGMVGKDILFGDSENDDLIGGWGPDWISGGTGRDGVLGDDGRIFTARYVLLAGGGPNGGVPDPTEIDDYAELLHGLFEVDELNKVIRTPGDIQNAIINPAFELDGVPVGEIFKAVDLTPFNVDPSPDMQDPLFVPFYANDIIFGGLGNDFLHGGPGDDAIAGAEALPEFFEAPINPDDPTTGNATDPLPQGGDDLLRFNQNKIEFFDYDEEAPRSEIVPFVLNFDPAGDPNPVFDANNNFDEDAIFGDLGNDWL
ncbi:MAG: hypothetical protein V3T72_06180, partial [Thermoanaerobaculia bacterium]